MQISYVIILVLGILKFFPFNLKIPEKSLEIGNSGNGAHMKRIISVVAVFSMVLIAIPTSTATTFSKAPSKQLVIGYISGGEASPYVHQVTLALRVQAKKLGVKLVECDTNFLTDKALECAKTVSAAKPKAMINWQFDPSASKKVCAAYKNLPTVTIDTPNDPCAKVFVGANNLQAGLLAGNYLGKWAKKNLNCVYDLFFAVELPTLVDINKKRAGGTRTGFEKICGAIPDSKYKIIDKTNGGSDPLENIRRQVTDNLTANPGAHVVLGSSPFSDGDAIAFTKAFDTAGRGTDLKAIIPQGAEEVGHPYIRTDSRWIGSVGYFPERYGVLVIPAAIKLAQGKKVPKEILTVHSVIDLGNIDQIYPVK